MNRLIAALLGLMISSQAFAQTPTGTNSYGSVAQKGAITLGDCASWAAAGLIQDSGAACGSGAITPSSISMTGPPETVTITPTSTGGFTLPTGGGGGSFYVNIASTDYSTWLNTSLRPFYFGAVLAPSVNTTNIWTQYAIYTTFAGPGQAQAEINNLIASFEMNTGETSTSTVENFEARIDNAGSLNQFVHYLTLSNNQSTGTATSFFGSKYQLINANVTAGAVTTYAAIDMEAMTGGGSAPTNYYFLRNAEGNAVISTAGKVTIGSLAVPGALLQINGPDQSGSTAAEKIVDSSSASIFTIFDNGQVTIANGPVNLGSPGTQWAKLNFANLTSGTLQLSPPSSGALSGTLTLPNVTGTLATISNAQTFSGAQTFSAGIVPTTITATAAAPTVAASQIGYGGTTAATTNCGSLASAVACVVINVAGTTHYIPYY